MKKLGLTVLISSALLSGISADGMTERDHCIKGC